MPRRKWENLISGKECPICDDLDKAEVEQPNFVAPLGVSVLRLSRNQYVRGYCFLIYEKHAAEIHELPPGQAAAFMADMATAGRAIASVFSPAKMNYQILGNAVPHLHCHIVPRYFGDPAPSHPIDPGAEIRLLKPAEYKQIISDLREALKTEEVHT